MPRIITISRSLIIWTLAILLAGLLLAALVEAGRVNQWSVAYIKHAMSGGGEGDVFPIAPEEHMRASLWLAREALSKSELEAAMDYLAPEVAVGNAEALRLQGRALEALGDFPAAVRSWVRARDFRSLHEAGQRASQEGRMEDALAAYRALQAIDPERGALPLADFLWWPYQNREAAVAVLEEGLDRVPHSPDRAKWMIRLGDFRRELGQYSQAEAMYLQALEQDPEAWEAFLGLGWARYGRGDGPEAAVGAFKDAIAQSPDNGRAYRDTARVLVKDGRPEEADAWYQMALDRSPDERGLFLERGNAARERGDLILALEVYAEALRRFPDYPSAHYEWAWALNLAGRPEAAAEAIERTLVLGGLENALYLLRAGQIQESLGDSTEAARYYRAALELQPGNAAASAGLDRLVGAGSDE